MAGIEKIYGNLKQYSELLAWLLEHNPEGVKYLRHDILEAARENIEELLDCDDYPIAQFSSEFDAWLWENCDLQFVREALIWQYNDPENLKEKLENDKKNSLKYLLSQIRIKKTGEIA